MIPEEAIRAALEAFLAERIKRKGELGADSLALLNALEAAAPYLMAQAWYEGRWAGIVNYTESQNPYGEVSK